MVSQENESSKDFTAIECKLRILHMFQLQREIECNRGFESEDDDDDYESEDDDDYDTQDDDDYDTEEDTQDDSDDNDNDDAEPTGEKDTSPRRYRSSEFPLFSPTFWGNSTNGKESTKPGVTPVMKDTSAGRYRTSEFPLFSPRFWGESKKGKETTVTGASLITKLGMDSVDPVPTAHEGHKLVPDRQPIKPGVTLTSGDIGDEEKSLLEKKTMEKIVTAIGRSNTSDNKPSGIPTFSKVRQKSLPPISKRQECHMTTRQKSLPPIEKQRKPKTAGKFALNKKDNTGRSRTAVTMPVLARYLNLPPSKPRFQGGPYEAKPFKLLPPIDTKSGGRNAKDKNDGDGHQKKGNPKPIKVRHTKKSAQIEQKAKAKRDAENDGKRKASAKPLLVRVPVSSAPKSKSTASCITVPEWSTPKHKKLPPIRKMEKPSDSLTARTVAINAKFNPSEALADVGVTSVVATMSEKIDTTEAIRNDDPIADFRESSTSRSSKSSRSSEIKRSCRDHMATSRRSRSSSSTRSKKSSRGSSPCRSSRNNLASRSAYPPDVGKYAKVSTHGSHQSTNRDDASERSRGQPPCTTTKSRCVSRRCRRDRKPRSPIPHKSGRISPKMKDKSDGNTPDNEYDYSPMSTARSSVHTNRSATSLSDTARTFISASNASRNMSTVKSVTAAKVSSYSSNVPKERPTSRSNVTKHDPKRQHIPSRPNTAPVSQTDVLPHPNTASSYPNSARHSSISVRPTKASLLRQKSISSRQSTAPIRQTDESVQTDTVLCRQSKISDRSATTPVRRPATAAGVRPTTAPVRHITEQNHPTTALVCPTTSPTRPSTAPNRCIATSSRQSTTLRNKGVAALPIQTSGRSAISNTSSRSANLPARSAIPSTRSGISSARSAISSSRSGISSARSAIPSTRSGISSARSATSIPSTRSGISSASSARSTCTRNRTSVLKTPPTVTC